MNELNINWYPGHMKKTKNDISKLLPIIDIVYELIDARIPLSSKIIDIDNLIKNKIRILIMTKKDLCDLEVTKKWVKYYEDKGYNVLLLDLNDNSDYKKVIDLTEKLCNEINKKRALKGLKEKEIKSLVVGIPNVGKSTLINKLASKKVANVGNMPGVTKMSTWLKTKYNVVVLDTPGILWPKINNQDVALNLAAMTAIKQEVLPKEDVAYYILKMLSEYYPNILKDRYGLEKLDEDYIEETYEVLAQKLGAFLKNKEVDYDKISNIVINDIKNEYIKGITFDRGI